MKKSFMDSIGDEKLAQMIDATFNYEKRGGVMRVGLLKMLPAVAAILLVIGLANVLPMINFGGDYGITPGAALEPEPVSVGEDDFGQRFEHLYDGRARLVRNINVTWTWARADENGNVMILLDNEPKLVTLEELDAIMLNIYEPTQIWGAIAGADSFRLYRYRVAVFSPENELVGKGFGAGCYRELHLMVDSFLREQRIAGNLTQEEADYYIASVPRSSD